VKKEWSTEPLNLRSPGIVNKISDALQKGMLFGVRTRYDAREACAYADLDHYLRSLDEGVAGDDYTLWSVEELHREGRLLLRKKAEVVSQAELEQIQSWLNGDWRNEFVAAGREHSGAAAEAVWGDYDSYDRLEELANRCLPQGELAVMSLNDHLEGERWVPTHHLTYAFRPNDRGEVPVWRP
jgi:hypothetical protein